MSATTGTGPPPDDLACAVCGRILYLHPGDVWQHGFADWLDEDHPPVPVKRSEIPEQLRPRCDFCSEEFPPFILPVAPFEFEMTSHASTANWAACDLCAKYLERNEWNGVYRRAVNTHALKFGPPPVEIQQSIRALHRLVRKNVTGALRRI